MRSANSFIRSLGDELLDELDGDDELVIIGGPPNGGRYP
jgi:hypothetical protein